MLGISTLQCRLNAATGGIRHVQSQRPSLLWALNNVTSHSRIPPSPSLPCKLTVARGPSIASSAPSAYLRAELFVWAWQAF